MLIQCSSECLISLQPNEPNWQWHIWQLSPQRFWIGTGLRHPTGDVQSDWPRIPFHSASPNGEGAATSPVGLVDRLTHLAKQLPVYR